MVATQIAQPPAPAINVTASGVHIENLFVADEVLTDFLGPFPADHWPDQITKALAVGVRGLTAMGAGATVKGVGEEIERLLSAVGTDTERRVAKILTSGETSLSATLDPKIRTSLTAQAVTEIETAHDALLSQLDLDRADSHTSRLVAELTSLLGPDGLLRERLREALDPGLHESAAARMLAAIDARFRDMRDLIVGADQRAEEAARGTAKGFDYESEVVDSLRQAAAAIGGCSVEATGRTTGALDAFSKVGDAVVTLPDGVRVAVEAKNTRRIGLNGKDGILHELDRAMVNRDAEWAICTSKQDAFPLEVGSFGLYGNRILLIDDGEGVLLRVALEWIRAGAVSHKAGESTIDLEELRRSLDRLRALAQRFTGVKRALSSVRASVDQVRAELDGLRSDLLDHVDDLHCAIRAGSGRGAGGTH